MANDCRAKDPNSCRVHGTSGTYEKLQAVAASAAASGDSALYMKTRAEMDALSDDVTTDDKSEPKVTAAEKAKKLRAELAQAEKAEKAERAAKRREEQERRMTEEHKKAKEYREENYEFTAGENSEYVGVNSTYSGVEIAIGEWSSQQSSASLSREQARALMEGLQKVLK